MVISSVAGTCYVWLWNWWIWNEQSIPDGNFRRQTTCFSRE